MTVAVLTSHRTVQGAPLKSARERMDIISAYREVGSYRGAAAISGTTPKTVRRVIARHESGGAPPHIAPNFTTLTTNAASSITPNTKCREQRRSYATTSK